MRLFLVRCAAACAFLAAFCVHAQVPDGSVSGLISDPQKRPIAGASITLTSAAQGFVLQATTNGDGLYVLPTVPAGRYLLRISQPGFAAREFTDTVVEAGRATTVDARMQVAAAGAQVEVNAAQTGLDLTQSMIQGEITSKTIDAIPLNGRNFLELAFRSARSRRPKMASLPNWCNRTSLRR